MSVEGFVQQLACNLVNKGYRYYFAASIPERKDPAAVDAKLVSHYNLDHDKHARARRKRAGWASVAYLRFGTSFVLLATEGEHKVFYEHPMRDIRRQPFVFHGYSIGCGRGSDGKYHASVKIHETAFVELLAHFRELAAHRSAEYLLREFRGIRFVPYARVRRQLLRLVREVNEIRKASGYVPIPWSAVELRRKPVRVFSAMPGEALDTASNG